MKTRIKNWLKDKYAVFLIAKSRFFDRKWYAQQALEGSNTKEGPAAHYFHTGWKTHNPSRLFDAQLYLQDNPDVKEAHVCPLYHFERYGKHEYRKIQVYTGRNQYRKLLVPRAVSRAAGRVVNGKLIEKNREARLLVCFQLFYPDSWVEVKQYLKNLAPYRYRLIVTYQQHDDMQPVLEDIQAFHKDTVLYPVNNIGFDIGGFWTALQHVNLDDYDIVFKIHSKGITPNSLYRYHRYFKKRDWFVYLFEGILGARTVHTTIRDLTSMPKCGMMAASNLLVQDPPHKQRLVKEMIQAYPPMTVPPDYRYVAGTCFAVRAELLKWFQQTEFEFAQSQRGKFSLAHALERALSFIPLENGYEIVGNRVCRFRQWLRRVQSKQYQKDIAVMDALLSDKRFDLDSEFAYRKLDSIRITGYELTTERLGNIRRPWYDGSITPLKETAPYRYLCGETEPYNEHCQYHYEHNLAPMSRERFDALIKSIETNGFDQRKVLVVRKDNNNLMDGQHRLCCLLKQYGEDYVVPVVKLEINDKGI